MGWGVRPGQPAHRVRGPVTHPPLPLCPKPCANLGVFLMIGSLDGFVRHGIMDKRPTRRIS